MSTPATKTKALNPIFSLERHDMIIQKNFYKKKRQVFVLTEAGKPIYTRYGDETSLCNVMATFSVIVHKMREYKGDGTAQNIHSIITNVNRTVFLKKNQLFFIIITTKPSDTILRLQNVLETLSFQITFAITGLYIKTLKDSPSYDPQEKLNMHKEVLTWGINSSQNSLSNIFNAFMPFPLSYQKRKKIMQSLKTYEGEGIIYKMLLTQHNIIAIDCNDYVLTTQEINALFHLINSKFKFVAIDFWLPICIPSISEDGYLNQYFRWINEDFGCLLLSADSNPNNIINAVQMCQRIEMDLEKKKLVEKIQKYTRMMPLEPDSFELEHLESIVVYKAKLDQYSQWGMSIYKKLNEDELLIMNKYCEFMCIYKAQIGGENDQNFEIVEKVRDRVMAAKSEEGLLIMICLKPWEDKETYKKSFKKLADIVKSDYHNIFLD